MYEPNKVEFCYKYNVTKKENYTNHTLFEPNNSFAIVLGFHL